MKRQPGSAAKPFTYAAAIESRRMTPASIVQDEPFEIQLARNRTWDPKNYDGQFRGPVTVREAFEKSLNVPAVRVASDVGVDRIQDVWHHAGFTGELSNTPAIALGVDDVTMRDLVAAYSMFPNLGVRTDPHLIESIEKGDNEIYRYEVQRADGIDPAVAYVVHALMRGVVIRGTAAGLNQYGLSYVAGKTGTTSNYRDAWFIGYVPDLLTAVWVGFDDGTALRMSSGEAAVPIFGSFLSRVPHRKDEIGTPQGVSIVEVEAASGLVWQPGCGPSVIEAFLAGTEPRQQCGGYYNGMQDLSIYTEPPMLSDEMAAQMAMYDSVYRVQPFEDPDLADMSMVDTATEVDDDTVVVDTPMVAPPRDTLRVPRPVLRDTIIDSLSTSDSLAHASLR
jgi:penicillin-binding protein 1A